MSPCGRIGISHCDTGAISASAAMRTPVNRLTMKASATTQCRTMVPISVFGVAPVRETLSRLTRSSITVALLFYEFLQTGNEPAPEQWLRHAC